MKKLSVIVIAYNMARELPRTIQSLSPALQRGLSADDYEIIVVDNGSAQPVPVEALQGWGADIRCISVPNPNKSPVGAVNLGLEAARGELCGVFIDGARMASPGLLAHALQARRLHDQPVISTVGFHLGPEHQSVSAGKGYDQVFEDFLLASIDWAKDPYRLFKVCCYAGSSPRGWFGPTTESNALFLLKSTWAQLGGYDPRFELPGGGLSNLDIFRRALELIPDGLVVLMGEGTFHQYHGGESSNSEVSKWQQFEQEYQRIRGKNWEIPNAPAKYFGAVHPYSMGLVELSANVLKL
ncbi:MAG: glycosyltransferase family A protein [Pseudomonas sp.]|uniref:glycosyltransferase family A protein n=1 Tax=Pseudomonas sp. TaxID=306 RepID=UPI003D0B51AC